MRRSHLASTSRCPRARSSSTAAMSGSPEPPRRSMQTKPVELASTHSADARGRDRDRPFDGLRILDLGVIVAGGELGRLFADLGAEVIKIESAAYPDGLRQTPPGQVMSRSWALTHRNEYALGLDLRSAQGRRSSPAWSPAPTPCSPTSSRERLHRSAFHTTSCANSTRGSCWPRAARSARRDHGAHAWATGRWCVPPPASPGCGPPPTEPGFYDATTVFPDHVVGRIIAVAALASLIGATEPVPVRTCTFRRRRPPSTSSPQLRDRAAKTAALPVADDPALHAVYPCEGEDEWCVISLRGDSDRARFGHRDGRHRTARQPDRPRRDDIRVDIAAGQSDGRRDASATGRARCADEPRRRRARRSAAACAESLFTDMAHPLFDKADAHRDRPLTVSPTSRGPNCGPPRWPASTPARSARSCWRWTPTRSTA